MPRIFAASDIHGNPERFKQALVAASLVDNELNWLNPDNWLILCGDYIDRGPDSKGMIDLLISLNKNPQVVMLLGNHEDMLLQGLEGHIPWLKTWIHNGGVATLQSYGMATEDIKDLAFNDIIKREDILKVFDLVGQEHIDFMASLLTHIILKIGEEKVLFVHAGVNPKGSINDLPTDDMDYGSLTFLWIRDKFYNAGSAEFLKKRYGVDRVVFGHTPTSNISSSKGISPAGKMIPISKFNGKLLAIDTGCNYRTGLVTIVEILPGFSHQVIATA